MCSEGEGAQATPLSMPIGSVSDETAEERHLDADRDRGQRVPGVAEEAQGRLVMADAHRRGDGRRARGDDERARIARTSDVPRLVAGDDPSTGPAGAAVLECADELVVVAVAPGREGLADRRRGAVGGLDQGGMGGGREDRRRGQDTGGTEQPHG